MREDRHRTAVALEKKHIEMELKWDPGKVSHPASAAVRVTDLSWRGKLNPCPLAKDDGELLMDEYLSPRKLKAWTGVDDLQQVEALEMRVDTRENSLGSFGTYLPNLRELKLNNSLLVSVRDLGTTLSHLHILWMANCGLSDLDGISSCSSLKELYIAYNNISELSQLTWLDHLKVLDLEGNNIEDISQMHYLGLCGKLSHLTLEGNLICLKPHAESAEEPDYNYRAEVKKIIPHLEYLDEIPASQTDVLPSTKTCKDWLIIKESIKEGCLAGGISWLGPTVPDELFTQDDSSELTHGLCQVMCGNPSKALRARRQKLGPPAVSPLCSVRTANLHGSGGEGGGGDLHQDNVFSELSIMDELPAEETNHQQPAVCSFTEASESLRLMNTTRPLNARAMLQTLPDRPAASTTSQNKSTHS